MTTVLHELKDLRGTFIARVQSDGARIEYPTDPWLTFTRHTDTSGRKTRRYMLAAGFYSWRVDRRDSTNPIGYLWSDGATVLPLDDLDMDTLIAALAGPNVGEDGTWNGDRCEDGNPVAGYTGHGMPYCDACNVAAPARIDDDMAVTA